MHWRNLKEIHQKIRKESKNLATPLYKGGNLCYNTMIEINIRKERTICYFTIR